jgi:DNA uptake protein ComE-like DNA-binding protein
MATQNQFQKITKISDRLLNTISPYFKFPDWVVKEKKSTVGKSALKGKDFKIKASTRDLNFATVEDFQTISGVNEYLAERIIKYRKKLKGFSYQNQLLEVWKLEEITAQNILTAFKIIDKPIINKVNVNTATFKQVLSNPYIDYDLCKKIFELRDEVAELQSIEELKKIEGFPMDKYGRIILYLDAK